MLVGLVTNYSKSRNLMTYDPHSREQAEKTTKAVLNALKALNHRVEVLEVGPNLLAEIERLKPDVIFNIAQGYRTKKEQANVAAMLEISGVPFTGCSFLSHVIGLGKHLSKMVFQMYHIPTPKFMVVTKEDELAFEDGPVITLKNSSLPGDGLKFPVIVKPSNEGSSVGISSDSVVMDKDRLLLMVRKTLQMFEPPCLIEEYIAGREFTVAFLGYPEPEALPVEEIIFGGEGMYTYAVKSRDTVTPVCPADIGDDLRIKIQDVAKRAFMAIGCRDIARVDIRLGRDQIPYVLEINTLPGLMPDYSEVPRIALASGMSYEDLIARILDGAMKRKSQIA